ncbi:MAG: biotin--[acetyl-CoA-carboxylase] ligase [Bdellovibrionales bacterium]|nr:biotin--[acetyl-CoA-carboxylase] ligase [Bdellovibrionales bacterium]
MSDSIDIFKTTNEWLKSHKIIFNAYESTDSTNNQAKIEASELKENTKVYIAAKQTAGRGRNNNQWLNSTTSNNLLATWSFHLPSAAQSVTSPIIGLSVYESLTEAFANIPFSIKAPNDIYIADKKALGILIESISMGANTRLIVGIGLNVFSHPEQISNSTHLSSVISISKENWTHFLEILNQNLAQAARAATGAHLTPEQRDRILIGLNQYPNLSEKYVSVSPFGDLVSEKKTTSWREL